MKFTKFLLKLAFFTGICSSLNYGMDGHEEIDPFMVNPHVMCVPEMCVYSKCPYAQEKFVKAVHSDKDIDYLEKLYELDQNVLSNEPYTLNVNHINSRYLAFYSIKSNEREYVYESDVKQRFYQILKQAANSSYEFPQTVLILGHPKTINFATAFQDIAIKSIFHDPLMGISALKTAVYTLKEKGKLTKKEKEPLKLYINLSAFFFDKFAIDYLLENCLLPFDGSFNVDNPEHRIQLIKTIQVQGEFLKNIHPWTLSLNGCPLPPLNKIAKLRDWLSHLSPHKLNKLLYGAKNPEEISNLFGLLLKDQMVFYSRLQAINKLHPLTGKVYGKPNSRTAQKQEKQTYERIWQSINNFKDNTVSEDHDWLGMTQLYDFLNPSPASGLVIGHSIWEPIIGEVKALYPDNTDEIRAYGDEQSFKNFRAALQETLQKNKGSEDFIQLLQSKNINLQKPLSSDEKEYYDNMVLTGTQIRQAFQEGQKDQGEYLSKKKNEQMNIFVHLLQGKSKEEAQQIENKRNLVDQIDQFINLIQREKIKPYSGRNSISEKYTEFKLILMQLLEKLDESLKIKLQLPTSNKGYSWSEEPHTLERWFHEVCKLPIQTNNDKNEYRHKKLENFLKLINQLRDIAGVQTTLNLEIWKNWLKDVINAKNLIVQHYLRENNLTRTSDPNARKIWEIINEIADDINQTNKKKYPEFNSENDIYGFYKNTTDRFVEIINLLKLIPTETFLAGILEELEQQRIPLEEEKQQIIEGLTLDLLDETLPRKRMHFLLSSKDKITCNNPRIIDDYLVQGVKNQLKDKYLTCQFLIGNFYEQLKSVKDYPELESFIGSDAIRNYFNHPTPFQECLIASKDNPFSEGTIYLSKEGTLAKEIMVLGINIKFILENLQRTLKT